MHCNNNRKTNNIMTRGIKAKMRLIELYYNGDHDRFIEFCKLIGRFNTQDKLSDDDINYLKTFEVVDWMGDTILPPYPHKRSYRSRITNRFFSFDTYLDIKNRCFMISWAREKAKDNNHNVILRNYQDCQDYIHYLSELKK